MLLKRKLKLWINSCNQRKKSVLIQKNRRLEKRNAKLNTILNDLREKSLLSTNSFNVLEDCAGGVIDLLQRQQNQKSPSYSSELKSFALTLHFYSPQAYRYVRKVFDTCLSHPRTIRKWYQSVEGFTSASFFSTAQ